MRAIRGLPIFFHGILAVGVFEPTSRGELIVLVIRTESEPNHTAAGHSPLTRRPVHSFQRRTSFSGADPSEPCQAPSTKGNPAIPPQFLKCPFCKNPFREKRAGGIWLDAGEFTRIYEEGPGAKVTTPLSVRAMAEAAAVIADHRPEA